MNAEQHEYFREQQHKKWLDKIAYDKAPKIVEYPGDPTSFQLLYLGLNFSSISICSF